ncbi:MAG: TetR/AcrR family transcriptional regulator [Phototrophicaceae bacterium]
MPRHRQESVTEATRTTIKDIARRLMAEQGTGGLSLRAIAREMDVTAPALYTYFSSLDDLITALIVDAFYGHTAYVQATMHTAAEQGKPHLEQLFDGILAYREWAVKYTTDFQLIYGNPIPGYHAPDDVTTPAAASMGQVLVYKIVDAFHAGEITPNERLHLPDTVRDHIVLRFLPADDEILVQAFAVFIHLAIVIHGMTMLEIHGHLAPIVGDLEAFYRAHLRQTFDSTVNTVMSDE